MIRLLVKFSVVSMLTLSSWLAHASCADLFVPAEVVADFSFLPDGSADLKASAIELSLAEEAPREDLHQNFKAKRYENQAFLAHTGLVSTVLYPASGADLVSSFKMFPNATLVIGIDNHQFHPDHARPPTGQWEPHIDERWDSVGRVDMRPGVLGKMISQLKSFEPKARVHRVYRLANKNVNHGWIEFDLGEGTPRRKYLHIHSRWEGAVEFQNGELASNYIDGLLDQHSPGAVMFKASMGLNQVLLTGENQSFGGYSPDGNLLHAMSPELKKVRKHLIRQHGLIIDGDLVGREETILAEVNQSVQLILDAKDSPPWGYSYPRLYKF